MLYSILDGAGRMVELCGSNIFLTNFHTCSTVEGIFVIERLD